MDLLKWFRGNPENPKYPITDDEDDWTPEYHANERTALTYSAIYRAVSLISGTAAKLDLDVLNQDKSEDTAHPAWSILKHSPNDYQTAFSWKQLAVAQMLLHGNHYSYVFRDNEGNPFSVIPLNPLQTHAELENDQLWYVTRVDGVERKLDPSNVIHFRTLGDTLQGYSVISLSAQSTELGLQAEAYASRFFKNNSQPSMVLSHPGVLSEQAKKHIRADWSRMHKGIERSHSPAVLMEGMDVKTLSINAKDAMLIETRQHELRSVANWFGLPLHMVGHDGRSAFASLEQENQAFLDNAVDPHLVQMEGDLWRKLLRRTEQENRTHTIRFNRESLVRVNYTEKVQGLIALTGAGLMTTDEAREKMGLAPLDKDSENGIQTEPESSIDQR